mmetsp:Transcript_21454/g.43484  ORF Transcript_21454/g.43484 Transcript_21454/m.43484 type:complete len:238 (-) Transcript_21454:254-967(-)
MLLCLAKMPKRALASSLRTSRPKLWSQVGGALRPRWTLGRILLTPSTSGRNQRRPRGRTALSPRLPSAALIQTVPRQRMGPTRATPAPRCLGRNRDSANCGLHLMGQTRRKRRSNPNHLLQRLAAPTPSGLNPPLWERFCRAGGTCKPSHPPQRETWAPECSSPHRKQARGVRGEALHTHSPLLIGKDMTVESQSRASLSHSQKTITISSLPSPRKRLRGEWCPGWRRTTRLPACSN